VPTGDAGNRKHKRCTRAIRLGTINRSSQAGTNRVAFSGRIGTRPLIRGAYRLTARAVDSAGNAGTPRRASFKVVHAGTL
jgi:hypothetical protein